MFQNYPPTYLSPDSEEYRIWLNEFVTNHNQLAITGSGGGAGDGNVEANVTTGRIEVDDVFYGYLYRYLHLQFSEDANGATLITDITTYAGSTLYVGVFNSPMTTTPPMTANFVRSEFTWQSGRSLYYRNTGGRTVRFEASDSDPGGGALLIGNTSSPIDLETGASVGATGSAGADAVLADITIRTLPETLTFDTASSGFSGGTVDPTDWNYDPDGMDFGSATVTKALVCTIRTGGQQNSLADRRTYSYSWTRNGTTFTPGISGVTTTQPFLLINVNDLEGRQDQFLCNVTDS